MKTDKSYANRGVARNKRPLKNIVYEVSISQLLPDTDSTQYEQYRFKEEGYIVMYWYYQTPDPLKNWHGFITPTDLKALIGPEQWRKFIEGKRTFIIQRREDGKNLPKTSK